MREPKDTQDGAPPPGDREATDQVPTRTAFIVRLGRDATGQFEGIVERARTGEKHRFHGLETLGSLIAGMAAATEPPK